MKKNNKKGFAIAEILAVTVAIMVIFVTVYSNFFPTTAEFERRMAYNDLESLYATYYMRQLYNGNFSNQVFTFKTVVKNGVCKESNNNTNCTKIATSFEIEEMIVTSNDITDLKEKIKNNSVSGISDDLQKYIKYLPVHFTQEKQGDQYRIILKTKSGYATSLLDYEKPVEPNKPTLTNNLLPIKYETDGTIKVTSSNDNEWYDYDKGKWANAVTIKESARSKYFDNDGYVIANDDDTVDEDDINTMWVWIPRYNYTIFNYNADGSSSKKIQKIEIHFENTTTPEGTLYCNDDTSQGTSEVCYYKDASVFQKVEGNTYSYGGTSSEVNGATYTHPAFCFGNRTIDSNGNVTCSGTELSGIWVGKYENSLTTNSITILPNKDLYYGKSLATYFTQIKSMELPNNIYGFSQATNASYSNDLERSSESIISNDNNNLDTHMMKNSEWGAVVYLTLSQYGIYNEKFSTTSSTTTKQDVSLNSTSITGGGGDSSSTTNNKTGIYDMVGGVTELVVSGIRTTEENYLQIYYDGSSTIWTKSNSAGRTYLSNSRYYNIYITNNDNTNNKIGKLGDATREVSTWLSATTRTMPTTGVNNPIFTRGGLYTDDNATILTYNASSGQTGGIEKVGSRSVLVINPNGGTL